MTQYLITACPEGVLNLCIVSKNTHTVYSFSSSPKTLQHSGKGGKSKGEAKDTDFCCINFGNALALLLAHPKTVNK